jgi:hypothetical protein
LFVDNKQYEIASLSEDYKQFWLINNEMVECNYSNVYNYQFFTKNEINKYNDINLCYRASGGNIKYANELYNDFEMLDVINNLIIIMNNNL